jgi:hypothetical protein
MELKELFLNDEKIEQLAQLFDEYGSLRSMGNINNALKAQIVEGLVTAEKAGIEEEPKSFADALDGLLFNVDPKSIKEYYYGAKMFEFAKIEINKMKKIRLLISVSNLSTGTPRLLAIRELAQMMLAGDLVFVEKDK